ncbi:MAG: transposase [Sediminicola sp.]|jgi:transposase
MDAYLKHCTAIKKKIHGERILGVPSKVVYRSLERSLKSLRKEIVLLEQRLLELVKAHQQGQLTLLKSIPGLGDKTAMVLLVFTDRFTKFENAGQLCCYAGITPTIRESGSSVRGRSRISTVGNRKLRISYSCVAFRPVSAIERAGKSMG